MIHSGEIVIGKPIVLIEYYVITVKDGKLVFVELILPKYKKIQKKYTLRFTTRGRFRKRQLYNLFIRSQPFRKCRVKSFHCETLDRQLQ